MSSHTPKPTVSPVLIFGRTRPSIGCKVVCCIIQFLFEKAAGKNPAPEQYEGRHKDRLNYPCGGFSHAFLSLYCLNFLALNSHILLSKWRHLYTACAARRVLASDSASPALKTVQNTVRVFASTRHGFLYKKICLVFKPLHDCS